MTIASFYALLFPSDQVCDVLDLLSQASQPFPHFRSSETQATGTVCLAARNFSAPSVLLSLSRPHSMLHKSLKTDVEHLHAVLEFPIRTFNEVASTKPFVFCVFHGFMQWIVRRFSSSSTVILVCISLEVMYFFLRFINYANLIMSYCILCHFQQHYPLSSGLISKWHIPCAF